MEGMQRTKEQRVLSRGVVRNIRLTLEHTPAVE